MADIKISELERVQSLNNGDLVEVSQEDSYSETGYSSKSAKMTDLGEKVVNGIEYTSELNTSNKKIIGAINEIASYTPVYGNTASGAIATFDTSLALPLQDCTIAINAVQESGTPTPSSPKLISGFTGANIKVAGKNLIDFLSDLKSSSNGLSISIDNGGIKFVNQPTASWADLSNTINVFLPKSTYTFSRTTSATYNVYIDVIFEDSTTATMSITSGTTSRTATYTKNIIGVKLHLSGLSTSTTYNETIYLQFEEGSTATTYTAYNANSTTYAITWQDEAGTVYGGSLDVTSGVLTVTHAIVDMGSFAWNNASGNLSSSSGIASDVKAPSVNTEAFKGLCSCYEVAPRTGIADKQISVQTNGNIVISDTGIASMTGAQVQSYVTGFILVYELATPTTYQLTPTQISAIVGTNNIFTDTNGDTSVVYACSLKDYIDGQ